MKTKDLLNIAQKCKKVTAKNNIPILDNILFKDGSAYAANLNSGVYLEYKISIEGEFLFDCNMLVKILSKLKKESEITFSQDENKVFLHVDGVRKFNVEKREVDDFPLFPDLKNTNTWDYSEKDHTNLLKAFKYVNNDDLRPVLNAVYVGKHIVATDAHKLCFFKPVCAVQEPFLIDSGIIPYFDKKQPYTCLYDSKHIKFVFPDYSVIVRNVEGEYPSYEAVIPVDQPGKVTLPKNELIENLNLAEIAANQGSKQGVFDLNGKVTLTSQDLDFKYGFEYVFDSKANLECRIGFKIPFLQQIISDIDSDHVVIKYTDPSRAFVVNDEFLLMPMKM